jgi:hypothetical protein
VPAIPFDEVKKITNNFSGRELIGEGSYGRVYNATLSDGRAAVIKKLDTSASQDSDSDFAAQVRWSSVTFTLLALLSLRPTEINATVRCLPRTSP